MPADIMAHVAAMAAGIREARGDIAAGHPVHDSPWPLIFARSSPLTTLRAHGLLASYDLRADEFPEGIDQPAAPALRVGGVVPWAAGPVMVPCVITALSCRLLPPELQYRFLLDDLLLIDLHANLVVDILPRALPPAEF